jgi:hypothetical protein
METSRYQLIDSLYGPGTVGAWLLTVSSVLISWTLNTFSRRKDNITVDFLATLILPLVAAAHLIFLVARLPVPVVEAFTTQDVEIQQYASAIAAPLCICETFSMAALVLALCCGPWWAVNMRMKRLGLVLLAGLLCWGTENVLFVTVTIKGVKMTDATLTRPYLFLMPPLVAYIWAYLALVVVCIGIHWVVDTIHERRTRNPKRDPERPSSRAKPILQPSKLSDRELATRLTVAAQKKMETELLRLKQHESRNQSQCLLLSVSSLYAVVSTPFVLRARCIGTPRFTNQILFSPDTKVKHIHTWLGSNCGIDGRIHRACCYGMAHLSSQSKR